MKELLRVTEEKMGKTISALERDYKAVRAGRANVSILDRVTVDYYGVPTPVQQMAAVSVPEARMLVIQPWDASTLKEIEKAILTSDTQISRHLSITTRSFPLHTLHHFHRHFARVKMPRGFGEYFSETVDEDRNDIEPQLFCQIKGATMEALNATILRTCSLWEYHNRIAFTHFLFQIIQHLISIRNGEEIRITNHDAIKRIMPYPVLSQNNQFGRQHHHTHQVEMRLMIADDYCWFVERFAMRITIRERCARHMVDDKFRLPL